MDDTAIRLDELTRMFNVVDRFPPGHDTITAVRMNQVFNAFVDRAAALLGQDGESDTQRRTVGMLALYGELPESQLAWQLAIRHQVDDIRAAIDHLLRMGRIERHGLDGLRLPK